MQGCFSAVDADLEGRFQLASWRKQPAVVTVSGAWYDMSMAPGNPAPNYYIGGITTATPLARSTDGGINHGGPVGSGFRKSLRKMTILSNSATSLPLRLILLDYLLFYPFIDESTTDPQAMTNIATLPRYADGKGVQMMAVVVAGQTGGQTFQVTYTNQDGVAGRVTPVIMQTTTNVNGTLISTGPATAGLAGPFLPLQEGDTGVRLIESVRMISGPDVGLFTLVLAKPLANLVLLENTAPVERDYMIDFSNVPRIEDDAYLNFIVLPNGSMSGVGLYGLSEFSWS